MTRYIAFLRAINVGGHVVKMEVLRELFSALKLSNVETFIASGNVIFETKAVPDPKLELKIEKHLEASLGYPVGTFVRSIEEIRAISVYKPFPRDGHVLNVGFVRSDLQPHHIENVKGFCTEVDDFHVSGREVYWLCQVSQADTKFAAKKFEKAIEGAVTFRSMKTVVRLAAKYSH